MYSVNTNTDTNTNLTIKLAEKNVHKKYDENNSENKADCKSTHRIHREKYRKLGQYVKNCLLATINNRQLQFFDTCAVPPTPPCMHMHE